MLSSAIKSDAFIPYKKSCFYKLFLLFRVLKREVALFFPKVMSQNCPLQSFYPKYLKNCYTPRQVLSLMFLIWNSITKVKFMVPIMRRQICFINSAFHICI